MPHLEEGILHALLDGEIPSAELPPIQAHLSACAECRARLEEERDLLETSDRLIESIELPEPRTAVIPRPAARPKRAWPRHLAWAATVVAALGLGYSAGGNRVRQAAVQQQFRPLPAALPRDTGAVAAATPPAESKDVATFAAPQEPAAGKGVPALSARAAERKPGDRREAAGAGEPQERRAAGDSALQAPAAGLAGQSANVAAAAPAPAVAAPPPPARARSLRDSPLRLEEVIVTDSGSRLGALKLTSPVTITLGEAVRTLGGTLRLVEGLIPERLEAQGRTVRVVYRTGYGELVLTQELADGRVRHALIAPPGFPADSLERLRARVRE